MTDGPRQLLGPDGTPVTVSDLPDNPDVVIAAQTVPVIPEKIHGCAIRVGLGPYPPDAVATHRKAMYAELRPVEETARKAFEAIGRERLLGWVPLTFEGWTEIEAEPDGELAEGVAKDALQAAVRELRSRFGGEL